MDTQDLLLADRSDHLKFVLKQCDKTEASLTEDVNILKDWLKSQLHLPEMPREEMIINFLLFNKFSIEKTKQKLDMYYTLRPLLPDFYENKHPKSPQMIEVSHKACTIPLPKLTKEGYRVTVVKLIDENSEKFDAYNFFALGYNIIEVRILEDFFLGDIIVYDLEFLRLGHILKFTPVCIKQAVIVLEKVFSSRIKGIHFINSPPFVDKIISIAKQLMKPKLVKRMHVHETMDALMEYIPREILPEDYGGKERSMYELNELWKQKFVQYQDRFDALEKMRTNEDLRPTPLVNDDILGFYGSFKKLNVD